MDFLTHFHSRNVYFYIHYSNSLKVTVLDMFQTNLGSHPLTLYYPVNFRSVSLVILYSLVL